MQCKVSQFRFPEKGMSHYMQYKLLQCIEQLMVYRHNYRHTDNRKTDRVNCREASLLKRKYTPKQNGVHTHGNKREFTKESKGYTQGNKREYTRKQKGIHTESKGNTHGNKRENTQKQQEIHTETKGNTHGDKRKYTRKQKGIHTI